MKERVIKIEVYCHITPAKVKEVCKQWEEDSEEEILPEKVYDNCIDAYNLEEYVLDEGITDVNVGEEEYITWIIERVHG